ncbi:hypothetical protein BS50DRAFT_584170 [Corynespora cassiicola Philippines]|uniref:Uncharacterized protein n=1 Tax=Corynespora cassiicola Philippines TaxID=1448308 RepID=A0A2T2P4N6_CORCC|nr:hypothetical protein BS50DRAFT_584170 [Corynespora cassiicola Philippines]
MKSLALSLLSALVPFVSAVFTCEMTSKQSQGCDWNEKDASRRTTVNPGTCYTSTVGSMVAPLVAINSGFSLASGVAIFGPDGSIATVGPFLVLGCREQGPRGWKMMSKWAD